MKLIPILGVGYRNLANLDPILDIQDRGQSKIDVNIEKIEKY